MLRRNFLNYLPFIGFFSACQSTANETKKTASSSFNHKNELLEAWQQSEIMTMTIAKQMPDDFFGFKATDEVMTYAEQFRHCAVYTCNQIAGRLKMDSPYKDKKPPVELTKTQTLDELAKMYVFVKQVIQQLSEEKMLEQVKFGKHTIPVWRFLYALENHIIHHRGQCVVYLRLKGIKPEGYYGW
ncbi:MAG: DinB family protein [Microscillaceae bacterium]|jgi:uncharacterized damage-inducible protein DinB|nr:DinB family protein [Microscillaceae bacterium]